jgi:hypothetical protein
MIFDIDQLTILNAAIKKYGEKAQVSSPNYIDTDEKFLLVYVTAYHSRSFKARFYYQKGSFDPKDPDLTSSNYV